MTPIAGRPVLTADEMRSAEASHGDVAGLMEHAGHAVATAVRRLASGAEVLILCGPGNNGGDGYVAARVLSAAGHRVRVAAACGPSSELAQAARATWTGPVEPLAEAVAAPIVVDALFGTGLTRPLDQCYADPLAKLCGAARLSFAVDLPSGLAADSDLVRGDLPQFEITLALAALKPAHVLYPAAARCGTVRVLDIGLPVESMTAVLDRPLLGAPTADSHKYSRGMVAVVAGAMDGAARLAATAAMRSGAGYVLLLGGSGGPDALVRRDYAADALTDTRIDAVVIGPGLGRDDFARTRLGAVVGPVVGADRPVIVDGDALHLTDPATLAARRGPTILTPHAGEFDALFGAGDANKIDRTRDAARRSRAVVVFKGADTVIAAPDGRVRVATGASPWLSTAGTGDVLAGAIGAMLAVLGDPFEAACAGVWLHADAARRCGAAFIADDLAQALTAARAGA